MSDYQSVVDTTKELKEKVAEYHQEIQQFKKEKKVLVREIQKLRAESQSKDETIDALHQEKDKMKTRHKSKIGKFHKLLQYINIFLFGNVRFGSFDIARKETKANSTHCARAQRSARRSVKFLPFTENTQTQKYYRPETYHKSISFLKILGAKNYL